MNVDTSTLAHYLKILQSEGHTHVTLSKTSLQTLRQLVSKPGGGSPAPSTVLRSALIPTSSPALPESRSLPMSAPRTITPTPTPILSSASSSNAVHLNDLDLESGTKAERLDRLRMRALGCQQCAHLVRFRTQVVFGVGNPEAQLMFVGEAPGADEDEMGEPFVGKAGQLLTKMIQAMGLEREQIYIGNVLKCRPDMPEGSIGNRKPTVDEMKTCIPYLQAQIKIIQPKVLVALGATAIEGLLHEKTPISKLRGRLMDFHGIPLMPTFHPSYLLRNQSNAEKRKVWEDLLMVMESLKLPISEKQRGYFLGK
ncbi:MAG: uracil-DNA glycosylase [Verrucomicrobiota bacterium]